MDWTAGETCCMIGSLLSGSRYYVNVLVKDGAGDKAAHSRREGPPVFFLSKKSGYGSLISTNPPCPDFGMLFSIDNNAVTTITLTNQGCGTLDELLSSLTA